MSRNKIDEAKLRSLGVSEEVIESMDIRDGGNIDPQGNVLYQDYPVDLGCIFINAAGREVVKRGIADEATPEQAKASGTEVVEWTKKKPYDAIIARVSAISFDGAPGGDRTRGPFIRSEVLYPLSYERI